jgi:hypothetical protein
VLIAAAVVPLALPSACSTGAARRATPGPQAATRRSQLNQVQEAATEISRLRAAPQPPAPMAPPCSRRFRHRRRAAVWRLACRAAAKACT